MRIELPRLRALVNGSAGGIGRAIAETLAVNGAEVAIDGRNKADVERVIGEIRGTVPSGRLVRAPGDAVGEIDILFNDVGT
jgi:NADP-dependent 3-hydroxy acid dehydrogenase YdfG